MIGSGSAKKASKKAQQARIDALNNAIGEQRRQFDITNTNFAPYRDIGAKGVAGLGDLTGVNGAPQQQSAIDALKASPFYQSLFRTGEENVLQTASATGGLRGGNTERSLADFGSDTLMQTIQQQLQNLGGLASIGQNATGSTATFGAHASDAISNDMTQQGVVNADGILTRGKINAQNWQNAGTFVDQAVSAALGAGAGPGGAPFSLGGFLKGF